MNKADFLVELEDILQREEPCNIDDNLEDYEEWDSLSKMSIMAYYDKNFGVKLSLANLKEVKTVSDLVALAGDKIQ
ncbi:acyl carrier protein [bacterium]|nr:acyl carrier protein [bacterium]